MLEAAGAHECFVDGREIVAVLIESGANGVEITERGEELQRARQQALTLKQLQQPSGSGFEDALTYRRRHDRAGVDQQLCGRRAREPLFSVRVAAVAIGARGHSDQAAVFVVVFP